MRFFGLLLMVAFAGTAFASPVRFDVATGNDLHILRPGEETQLKLIVRNDDPQARTGKVEYQISDTSGEIVHKNSVTLELPSKGETTLALPAPAKFGPYQIRCLFNGEGGDIRKQEPVRFAYMKPAGPIPGRVEGFVLGMNTHFDNPEYSFAEREKMAKAASWCGAKVVRNQVYWSYLQPRANVWNDGYLKDILFLLNKYHLELAGIVDGGAPWTFAADWKPANPENKNSWAARPDYEKWRAYVRRIAETYRNQLRFVEVMNEVNGHTHHNFTPEEYGELLKIAYAEIKRAAPETTVLSSGLMSIRGSRPSTPNYHSRYMKAIKGNYDIFAMHNHGPLPDYIGEVSAMENMLAAANAEQKPWWSNETALSSAVGGELFQAETLYAKLLYSWAKGAMGYNWYNLRNKSAADYPPDSHEPHFGLITFDFYPKFAYVAYNTLAANLSGAKFLANLNEKGVAGRDVYCYLFRQATDGYVMTFLRTGENTTLQLVSNVNGKVFECDLWGNEKRLSVSGNSVALSVGPRPVFLRFEGQKGEPKLLGEFLSSNNFLLFPGHRQKVNFLLHNPIGTPLAVKLAVKPAAGLKIDPAALQLTAEPGATIPAEFTFDSNADFRAGEVEMQVDAGKLWQGTLKFFVQPAIKVETEYGKLPSLILNRRDQYSSTVPVEPSYEPLYWKGPQDVSAKVWLAQANNRLKLRVEVADDRHAQPWKGDKTWMGDNIQLGIQIPQQDVYWEIGLTRCDDGTSEVFLWSQPSGFKPHIVLSRIQLKTSRDDAAQKTVYEAEIPFNAIGLTPDIGRTGFLFNLLVNDCDDGKNREGFISAAPGLGDTKNSAGFPLVCF